jgi:acetylglutamate kinase
MKRENLTAKFVDGQRVTDAASITIIERVLGETIGPSLARELEKLGGRAKVVPGQEVLVAQKAPLYVDSTGQKVDLGFVGDVVSVEIGVVRKLIEAEIVPVISPLGRGPDGQLYNVNADIAAAQIARALQANKIIYLSDVNGVRRDPKDASSLIPSLNPAQIAQLKKDGVIAGGMIPKVDSALECLANGVSKVHFLDGRESHALLLELFTDAGVGTEIAA